MRDNGEIRYEEKCQEEIKKKLRRGMKKEEGANGEKRSGRERDANRRTVLRGAERGGRKRRTLRLHGE